MSELAEHGDGEPGLPSPEAQEVAELEAQWVVFERVVECLQAAAAPCLIHIQPGEIRWQSPVGVARLESLAYFPALQFEITNPSAEYSSRLGPYGIHPANNGLDTSFFLLNHPVSVIRQPNEIPQVLVVNRQGPYERICCISYENFLGLLYATGIIDADSSQEAA